MTGWQPRQVASTLVTPLAHEAVIASASLDWGQRYPGPPPEPNAPARTLRATSYDLVVSADGRDWRVVAGVRGRGSGKRDVLAFPLVLARYVGVRITAAIEDTPPVLEELTVPAA